MGGGGGGIGNIGGMMGSDWFGGISDLSGVSKQARNAQSMAMAEQRARQAVTTEARAARDRANLAAKSPQQLAALERSYAAAQTQVDSDLKQLAAIDPAIMEASKQVLTLLQGGQAAVNNPMMQQRNQQRTELVNSLRSQYGPGAESSSIGQRALQQFDMQTNTAFQQNQQNTLGNLFGIATTHTGGVGFSQLMNSANGFGDYQNRILNAQQVGDQGVLQAMSGEVQGAGAEYTGSLIKAGAQRQFMTDIHNDGRQIGRTWATLGQGSKGGGGNLQSQEQPIRQNGAGNSGSTGGYQLSNPGTTNSNFWSQNPYE